MMPLGLFVLLASLAQKPKPRTHYPDQTRWYGEDIRHVKVSNLQQISERVQQCNTRDPNPNVRAVHPMAGWGFIILLGDFAKTPVWYDLLASDSWEKDPRLCDWVYSNDTAVFEAFGLNAGEVVVSTEYPEGRFVYEHLPAIIVCGTGTSAMSRGTAGCVRPLDVIYENQMEKHWKPQKMMVRHISAFQNWIGSLLCVSDDLFAHVANGPHEMHKNSMAAVPIPPALLGVEHDEL